MFRKTISEAFIIEKSVNWNINMEADRNVYSRFSTKSMAEITEVNRNAVRVFFQSLRELIASMCHGMIFQVLLWQLIATLAGPTKLNGAVVPLTK